MTVNVVLSDSTQVEAFKNDWILGVPCKTMASIYGFANANSVSRKAKSLGLSLRCIHTGRLTAELSGGSWKVSHGIKVWVAT